jgi:hypothetical protein
MVIHAADNWSGWRVVSAPGEPRYSGHLHLEPLALYFMK